MTAPFNPYDPGWIIEQNAANDAAVPPGVSVVQLEKLPTADPHSQGQVWNNNGTPVVSNG